MNANQAPPVPLRANSLALAFQDVITVILRVRYRTQRVSDANSFRESIRKMILTAAQEGRNLGYDDATSKMALYAIVGFLDESVLNSGDPTFAEWGRRPLQEEMFGGHFAGEYFFKHTTELLNANDSPAVADALELHAVCLLLGYRGKYAFGDNGEISQIIRRIREKIGRIRGALYICRVAEAPAVATGPVGDPWVTRLLLLTAAMFLLALISFGAYYALLGSTLGGVQTAGNVMPIATHAASVLAAFFGGAR
jgi:type VI secretion system protein ImpK